MGAKLVKFSIKPKENEQIDAIIKVPEERRSVIHGVVLGVDDKPVKDAVVKLFILKDPRDANSLCPISHTFTDDCGQFLFGPLCPNREYVIKVWYNAVKFTDLIVHPKCDDECLDGGHLCEPCEHE
jgi:hypothetical protein